MSELYLQKLFTTSERSLGQLVSKFKVYSFKNKGNLQIDKNDDDVDDDGSRIKDQDLYCDLGCLYLEWPSMAVEH